MGGSRRNFIYKIGASMAALPFLPELGFKRASATSLQSLAEKPSEISSV